MRTVLVTAVMAAALAYPAMASAQDTSMPPPADGTMSATSSTPATNGTVDTVETGGAILRGIRVEGNVGWDRFQGQGRHHSKLGYGATVGFDGQYNRFVLGAEGSFWHEDGRNGVYRDYGNVAIGRDSYREWGAAVRAGFLVTPQLLVFGKGGYVNNEQHVFVTPTGGSTSFGREYTDGYQYGGGVEYSMPMMHMPFYISAQYVRSEYDNGTSRQRVMGGVGLRFR